MKKPVGKTKEELALEKKRELEKRLQDVSGQLNSAKKPPKKGERGLQGGIGVRSTVVLSTLLSHCSQREARVGAAGGRFAAQRLQLQLRLQQLQLQLLVLGHQRLGFGLNPTALHGATS